MARLGGAGACLCDLLAGGVLVYSEDGVVLVRGAHDHPGTRLYLTDLVYAVREKRIMNHQLRMAAMKIAYKGTKLEDKMGAVRFKLQ